MAFERIIQTRYEAGTAGFDRGTRRVEQQLARIQRTADDRLARVDARFARAGRAALAFGATLAGAISLDRLRSGIEGAISRLDDIAKSADKIGLTTDALQELRVAGDLSAVSAETLDGALRRLVQSADQAAQTGKGGAADAFRSLGVEVTNAAGGIRPLEQLLNDIADGLAATDDTTRRAALSAEIFGARYGVELVNLLGKGSAALADLRGQARELGLVIDEDLIRQAEVAGDTLDLLGKVVSANLTVALANLAPALISVSEFLASLSSVLREDEDDLISFSGALQGLAVAAVAVAGGRGLGAIVTALQAGAAARAQAVADSARLVAATRAEIAAAEANVVAKGQVFAAQTRNATSAVALERSKAALVAANGRLTAAEAAATLATNAQAAAQARLSLATRATAAAAGVLRGALAFVGGVPGLIVTAGVAALVLASNLGSAGKEAEDLAGSVGQLEGALADVEAAQKAYRDAIAATAGVQTTASNRIVADTKREFEAKKSLLELEVKRQESLQAERRARGAQAAQQVNTVNLQLLAQARFAETAPEISAKRRDQLNVELDAALDEQQRIAAELTLADIAIAKANEALASSFDGKSSGGGVGVVKAVREQRDAYAELVAAAEERQRQIADEIALTLAAASEQEYLAERQRLLAEARSADLELGAAEIAQIEDLARAQAVLSGELAALGRARQIVSDLTEASLTTEERMLRSRQELADLLPQIIALVGDEARAHEILEAAMRRANDAILADDPMRRFADEIFRAAEGARTVEEALNRVLIKVLEILAQDFFNSLFGGQGGSPLTGAIGSAIGSIFSSSLAPTRAPLPPVRPRASGGPVMRGRPYLVGERRPELFVPDVSGRIVPRVPGDVDVPRFAPGGRALSVTVEGSTIVMQNGQATPEELQRILDRRDRDLVRRIVEMNDRDPTVLHT